MVGVAAGLDGRASRRAVLVCAATPTVNVVRSHADRSVGSSDSQTYWRSISMPSLTSWFMTGVTTSWLGSLSSIRCHPASAHLQSSAAQCSCGWRVRLEAGGGGVPVVVEQDEGDVGLLPRGGRDLLLLVEPPAAQPRGLLRRAEQRKTKSARSEDGQRSRLSPAVARAVEGGRGERPGILRGGGSCGGQRSQEGGAHHCF